MDSAAMAEYNSGAGVKLKRKVGLFSATSVVISSVIGSGIFVSPSMVFINSGSVGADLLVWLTAGIMSIVQAVCMAELGSLIPASGGEYAFLSAAGDSFGRPGDFVSFMYVWGRILIGDPLSDALQGLAFSSYALRLVYPSCQPPYAATVLLAMAFIALAATLNAVSVGTSARLQNAFVFLKIVTLLSIVGTAIGAIFAGTNHLTGPFFGGQTTAWGLAHAYVAAYLTMDGGATVCNLGEEVKNPSRNLPLALFLGMLTVIFLYTLTNVAYFIVLEHSDIGASDAVALTFAIQSWGTAGAIIMPAVASVSAFASLSVGFFSNGRLAFAAARKGHLPLVLSSISLKSSLPVTSLILRSVTASLFTFLGSLKSAINGSMLFVAFFNLFMMLALVRLRFTMKDGPRWVTAPYLFVLLSCVGSVVIIVANIAEGSDYIMFLVMTGILFSGSGVYFAFHVEKCRMPGFRTATTFLQKLFICQPYQGRGYGYKINSTGTVQRGRRVLL
ncbi:Y+L amino acid transporter 2-like [Haemaphysalis longicornis]